jgi:very-short-patch-repair endonuclease
MSMFLIFLIPLALLMILIIVNLANKGNKTKKPSKLNEYPFYKKKCLFTEAELSFYRVLIQVTSSRDLHIFAKVRLADLIDIKKGTNNRQGYFNKIKSKHIDFVLCNQRLEPVIAIELDDASHKKSNRVSRDEFLNKALENANLKILRIPAQHSYNVNELNESINKINNQSLNVAGLK